MSIGTLLILILLLILIGAVPAWPFNRNWGPYPAGLLVVALIVVVLLISIGAL